MVVHKEWSVSDVTEIKSWTQRHSDRSCSPYWSFNL